MESNFQHRLAAAASFYHPEKCFFSLLRFLDIFVIILLSVSFSVSITCFVVVIVVKLAKTEGRTGQVG